MLARLAIALDLAGALSVSDRTELRARAPGPSSTASFDAETAIAARLQGRSPRFRYTFGYTPRLTIWNAGTAAAQLSMAHGGEARVEWISRLARLSLGETADYGLTSVAASPLGPGPDGQPPQTSLVPTAQVLKLASSQTTLTSTLTLRRWTATALVGYQVSGGADADARSYLPRRAGPSGEASVDYALSRSEHAAAKLSASETALSSGPEAILVDASLGYRRRWSRSTDTSIAVGVGETRATVARLAAPTYAPYLVVEGSLVQRAIASSHVDARASVRLGPLVDPFTGLVDERLQATLGASYEYARLSAGALFSVTQSVRASSASAVSLFAGELRAGYAANTRVAIDAGVRALWQRQEATGIPFSQGAAFIGVTLRAPPIRL